MGLADVVGTAHWDSELLVLVIGHPVSVALFIDVLVGMHSLEDASSEVTRAFDASDWDEDEALSLLDGQTVVIGPGG